jgi:sugar-phosphatase
VSAVHVEAQGLLFDMDGVLVSSIASAERCWKAWARHYGLPHWEQVTIPHGVRAEDIVRHLAPHVDVAEGLHRIEQMEIADVDDIITLPGARDLLEGLPLERWAIVTSATDPLLKARLAAAKLPQPDPQPYEMGAERLGVSPHDCLVFEDAASGVRAGIAAGARVVAVLGTTPEAELREAGASWVVHSLAEVTATSGPDGLQITIDAMLAS